MPDGGTATSKTPTPAPTARYSQVVHGASVTLPVTLRAALGRVPRAHHMLRRASMRAKVLTEVENDYGAVTQLLLT